MPSISSLPKLILWLAVLGAFALLAASVAGNLAGKASAAL